MSASQEQFAAMVGITQPAVSKLLRLGILSRNGTLIQWNKEYCANLREQAGGRQSPNTQYDLMAERARLAARQSEKLEIELAALRQELLPVEAIVKALDQMHAAVRSKVMAIPSRFKSLSPQLTPKQVDILDGLVREILAELSDERLPPDIGRIVERYFSDLQATSKVDRKRVGGRPSRSQPRERRGAR